MTITIDDIYNKSCIAFIPAFPPKEAITHIEIVEELGKPIIVNAETKTHFYKAIKYYGKPWQITIKNKRK